MGVGACERAFAMAEKLALNQVLEAMRRSLPG